jgi:hypothetical protein
MFCDDRAAGAFSRQRAARGAVRKLTRRRTLRCLRAPPKTKRPLPGKGCGLYSFTSLSTLRTRKDNAELSSRESGKQAPIRAHPQVQKAHPRADQRRRCALSGVRMNAGALEAKPDQTRSGSDPGCSRPIGERAGRGATGCATPISQHLVIKLGSGASPGRLCGMLQES